MALLLLLAAFYYWASFDRITDTRTIYPRYVLEDVETIGHNTGKGNVIAFSPYLHTYDFSSREAYSNMLRYYLNFMQRKGILKDSTILVLPEYIGSWLVAVREKKDVYSDTSLRDDMKLMAAASPLSFLWAYAYSANAEESVFRMKANEMLNTYQQTYATLAKDYKIYIVAGSIVLPDPYVEAGRIHIRPRGKLYNVSAVFDRDGKVLAPLSRKAFPIREEQAFTCSAPAMDVPVYATPSGKLAVLICADAWYPECYTSLKARTPDILAVPSFVSGDSVWAKPWQGYDGAPAPADVDQKDIGKITEREAWIKYAMCGRAVNAGIRTGVNTFLRGDLWNLGTDGHTLVRTDSLHEAREPHPQTGSLINVWLE